MILLCCGCAIYGIIKESHHPDYTFKMITQRLAATAINKRDKHDISRPIYITLSVQLLNIQKFYYDKDNQKF